MDGFTCMHLLLHCCKYNVLCKVISLFYLKKYVTFGENVFIAPHVSIYTAGHPIDAKIRNTEVEYARPVTIGSDVWIGGNVVINSGVTIGDDVVIGSGSVVTKDIPSHVIAAGNPCKVIREITEEDRIYWEKQYQEYKKECEKNVSD